MNLLLKGIARYRKEGLSGLVFATQDYIDRRKSNLVQYYYTRKLQHNCKGGNNLSISRPSNVNRKTSIGDNVSIVDLEVRGTGPLKIGNNSVIGPEVMILTRNHNYEGEELPFDKTYREKKVTIEENVWIGARTTILPGVSIGEGAIIQAGSTVAKDIPPCAIVGGHPAETFDTRDEEHYWSLKKD